MPHDERARMITLHTLMQFFGWMLMINLVFFAIGLLKITVFKDITSSMTERLFGEFGRQMIADIPKILMSSKYLLLPYSNKVSVNSKNLEVSNYMSPLKMFDYLASGKTIIASNLKVYSHILKNNFNCLMPKKNESKSWINLLNYISKKKINHSYLRENALNTASKYTWDKRTKRIVNYFKKKLLKDL